MSDMKFPIVFPNEEKEFRMRGLGFLIWRLSSMPSPAIVAGIVQRYGIKWVSLKVAQSKYPYNQIGGNDRKILEYRDAILSAGASFGGWHYMTPDYPGPQGDLAEERREKLDLSHYLLDIESEYKDLPYGVWGNLQTTLDKLHNGILDVYYCSYKFPEYHPEIPHPKIMGHEKVDGTAPQVYWERAHNVAAQLDRSLAEYRKFTNKPFVPIGSTYSQSYPDGVTWNPTPEDFAAFVEWCLQKNISTYGFYSLDWVIENNRWDWMEAIAGVPTPPPPPPPPPSELVVANCDWLNARSAPSSTTDNRRMVLRRGVKLEDLHQDSGNWKKVRITEDVYVYGDYVEGVQDGSDDQ